MMFHALELLVWTQIRIGVIEPNDEAETNKPVSHMVHPSTAVGVRVEGPTHGVNDFAGAMLARVYTPNLLDAETVCLWVRIVLKVEAAKCSLGERPPRALCQESDLRTELHARFEIILWSSLPINTYIIQSHSLDCMTILRV
jgi:hypothetical protein